jgi:hypothetical protein
MNAGRREALVRCLHENLPLVPAWDLDEIILHALETPSMRPLPPARAGWLSTVAHIRHAYTDYDALLAEGYDVDAARFFVAAAIDAVLADWGCRRRLED